MPDEFSLKDISFRSKLSKTDWLIAIGLLIMCFIIALGIYAQVVSLINNEAKFIFNPACNWVFDGAVSEERMYIHDVGVALNHLQFVLNVSDSSLLIDEDIPMSERCMSEAHMIVFMKKNERYMVCEDGRVFRYKFVRCPSRGVIETVGDVWKNYFQP